MVTIRLARGGMKKRPFYHVVATDSRSARDGKFLERLGYYNPSAQGQSKTLELDLERIDYWKGVGAQVSDRVIKLIKDFNRESEQPGYLDDKKLAKTAAKREREAAAEEKARADRQAAEEAAKAEEEAAAKAAEEEAAAAESEESSDAEEAPAEEEEKA